MESGHSVGHVDEETTPSASARPAPAVQRDSGEARRGDPGAERRADEREGSDPDEKGAAEVGGDGARNGSTEDQRLQEDVSERNERRLTLEQLTALTAVVGSLTLVLSVIYDWGFLSALGISIADAPTSLADHLGSWLEWAPRYAILMALVVLHRLIRVRAVFEIMPAAVSSSLPTKLRWTKRKRRASIPVAVAMFILWLLIGGSPALLAISAIILWMILVDWITDHPQLTPPRSVLFLVRIAPVLVLLFFTFGYWSLDRVDRRTMPKAYVQIRSADVAGSPWSERYVLRSFANWLLVQDHGRTQVDWVRMEQVDRIEVHPEVRFPGLLCDVLGLWCRGDSGVNPASSLPDGTDADSHEPISARDPLHQVSRGTSSGKARSSVTCSRSSWMDAEPPLFSKTFRVGQSKSA